MRSPTAPYGGRQRAGEGGNRVILSSRRTRMSKVRWGVLSTANIGTGKVIPAMQRCQYGEVVGIASRNLETARQTAARMGIPQAYGAYEDLLSDPAIDA